ncbi:MAG: hypothetical protein K6G68_03710 [Oscillospiraceae bacterium]|nr:hypothetical protein [Oscillospiraceae bacterium]
MGGGSWTRDEFVRYSRTKARTVRADGTIDFGTKTAGQIYVQRALAKALDPYKVIRECCDSEEHPNTIPVILALDVTGSMGETAVMVASELNTIMTELYGSVKDVEFMIMGIGDFSYDRAPLQVSQFESDIRVAEQLDKVYFEFGGGGNKWESYSAAWAFGITQCRLDCWKRGKKGIIITMGDEILDPYIPLQPYNAVTGHGDDLTSERDISTPELYERAKDKFDIYHIDVAHRGKVDISGFEDLLGADHVFSVPVKGVAQIIAHIVREREEMEAMVPAAAAAADNGFISW